MLFMGYAKNDFAVHMLLVNLLGRIRGVESVRITHRKSTYHMHAKTVYTRRNNFLAYKWHEKCKIKFVG